MTGAAPQKSPSSGKFPDFVPQSVRACLAGERKSHADFWRYLYRNLKGARETHATHQARGELSAERLERLAANLGEHRARHLDMKNRAGLLKRLSTDPRMRQVWENDLPAVAGSGPGTDATERRAGQFIRAALSPSTDYSLFRDRGRSAADLTKDIEKSARELARLLGQATDAGGLMPMEFFLVNTLLGRAQSDDWDWPLVRPYLVDTDDETESRMTPMVGRAWEKAPTVAQLIKGLADAAATHAPHHSNTHVDDALKRKESRVNEYVRAFASYLRKETFSVDPPDPPVRRSVFARERQKPDKRINTLHGAMAVVTNVIFELHDGDKNLMTRERVKGIIRNSL